MNKIFLLSIMFLLVGRGTSFKVLPKVDKQEVASYKFKLNPSDTKKYMYKYLPANIEVDLNSKASFLYEFSDNNMSAGGLGFDALNLFNPLIIVGFPMGQNNFAIAGNLKIYNENSEVKFSSACVSTKSRSLFSNTNLTQMRKDCIIKIKENLKQQINISYSKGELDGFK